MSVFEKNKMSGEIGTRVEEVFNFQEKHDDFESYEKTKSREDTNKTKLLGCEICKIKVTSSRILQRHLEGRKHRMRADRQGKVFKCDLCDITANSEIQLDIHLKSSRHRAKVERKEYTDFVSTPSNKGIWILCFCAFCIFINLVLLFNTELKN